MTPEQPFDLVYAPAVKGHLRAIERKWYSLIRDVIETQLSFDPDVETRNRKPLKRSITELETAEWEIRFGADNRFRVFYAVNRPHGEVYILAIGEKRGERLLIGGEAVDI